MSIVPLGDIANDCSAPHLGEEPKARQSHLDDWFDREGTRNEGYGIVMVHADGDDPFYGPHLGDPEERQNTAAWVYRLSMRAENGLGLGKEAYDPSSHPMARMFEKIPDRLLRQRDVMQCLRGEGFTTRFDHEVASARIAGLIAVRAGLSAPTVQLVSLVALFHDSGHDNFAHSSEKAIYHHLLKHGVVHAHETWDHAENSGHHLSRLKNELHSVAHFDAADELAFQDGVHGVSNHSWHLRHGQSEFSKPGTHYGAIAADLAGASDRIAYSLSDTLDAFRAGRMRWEDLGRLFPRALAFARFDKNAIQRLVTMGFDRGGEVFREALEKAFTNNFAKTIRTTGIVGLDFEAADALRETRSTAKDYLFGLEAHHRWEEKLVHFCEIVLDALLDDARRDGYEDNAVHESIRRFGEMTETEVITMAKQRELNVEFDLAELSSAPELGARSASRSPRVRRLNTRPIEPLSEVLGHVVFLKADDGEKVDLRAEEAMNLFHLLNASGKMPLSLKIRDRKEVNPNTHKFTLPTTSQEKLSLFNKLESALEDALGRVLLANKKTRSAQDVHSASVRYLTNLYYNRGERPPAALKEYSEAFHESLAVNVRSETLGPAPATPVLSITK